MSRGSIGLDDRLNDYVVKNHAPEHPVLAELRILTGRMPNAQMQIAPEQGKFLAFLVHLIGATNTLEVGTFTGYSALAVALALPAKGKVVACDVSEEWTGIGRKYWEKAGVAAKIDLRIGPAIDTLKKLAAEGGEGRFDFAFLDAEKTEYDDYYELTLPLLRKGGLVALDNMLRDGDVADPKVQDRGTKAIRALNRKIAADPRVEAVLLPLGDGLTVARKL
ncbi:MAG: class I SAM-dependent methyltransferase [Rhizobiales bacterium]|nr:class I SAM-dependent methyltransferase [Hyphomicrobiales bacterium]